MKERRVGVSRLSIEGEERSLEHLDFVEFPAEEYFLMDVQERMHLRRKFEDASVSLWISVGLFYFNKRDDQEVFEEKWIQLIDEIGNAACERVIFRLNPTFGRFETQSERVLGVLPELKKACPNVSFDACSVLTPEISFIEGVRRSECDFVRDPLWTGAFFEDVNPKERTIWKIHGWHPDRWVRFYGGETLRTLKRKFDAEKNGVDLLFAHSQRETEARLFKEMQ